MLVEDNNDNEVTVGMSVDINGVGGGYEIVEVTANDPFVTDGLLIRLDSDPASSDDNWVEGITYDVIITGVSF